MLVIEIKILRIRRQVFKTLVLMYCDYIGKIMVNNLTNFFDQLKKISQDKKQDIRISI